MEKSNTEPVPNNDNIPTAECKCLLLTDRLSGNVPTADFHKARDSDQTLAGEILEYWRADDLIVCAMGFVTLETLHEIEAR